MRRMSHRISRRGALLALGAATLAACSRTDPDTDEDEADMDLSATNDAVMAASTRVRGVDRSKREVDGLGHALFMELRLDTADPMSTEDLDAIVEAIWKSLPWKPNAVRLVAVAEGAEGTAVDLRTAAEGLEPVLFDSFGQGGVSLIGLHARYGEWKKPA